MPRTPSIRALVNSVWYEAPGAALPKPTVSASSTPGSLVNVCPKSVECHSPYGPSGSPPASQISPAVPGSALNRTLSPAGSPAAGDASKVAPPSLLT